MAAATAVLMLVGAIFIFLGALGAVRLPDLFTRMQAATKASVLGAGSALLALAVFSADVSVFVRSLATIAFIGLTTPVAAHMIGRAAYLTGVALWEGTVCDELRGRYDVVSQELRGDAEDRSALSAGGGA